MKILEAPISSAISSKIGTQVSVVIDAKQVGMDYNSGLLFSPQLHLMNSGLCYVQGVNDPIPDFGMEPRSLRKIEWLGTWQSWRTKPRSSRVFCSLKSSKIKYTVSIVNTVDKSVSKAIMQGRQQKELTQKALATVSYSLIRKINRHI
jgi:hypothetical protein